MSACLPCVDVRVVTPHRFSYYESEVDPDELLLVVTQSGLSTNALAALDAIRAQGARAVCLTGDVEADAREHADLMVDWGAGVELVGYVTKGVSTLALFLMMFACRLGGRLDRLPELGRAVDVLDAVRASTYSFFERHEKALTSMRLSYSVAADGARGVALESALKVGETVHVPSPAYALPRARRFRVPAVRPTGEPSCEQRARQQQAAPAAQAFQGDRRREDGQFRQLRR